MEDDIILEKAQELSQQLELTEEMVLAAVGASVLRIIGQAAEDSGKELDHADIQIAKEASKIAFSRWLDTVKA